MDQLEIAISMRQQELKRRAARLAALAHNEAALRNEPLTEGERIICERAAGKIKETQLALEKEMTPGYWQRLWAAIRGR